MRSCDEQSIWGTRAYKARGTWNTRACATPKLRDRVRHCALVAQNHIKHNTCMAQKIVNNEAWETQGMPGTRAHRKEIAWGPGERKYQRM